MATYNSLIEFNRKIYPNNGVIVRYEFQDDDIINLQIGINDNANLIIFENCTFNKKVFLKGTYNNTEIVTFKDCKFNMDVSFDDSIFSGKVRIQNCTFHKKVTFNNTRFEDLCDFWGTTFKSKIIFFKTDFLKTTVFTRVTFCENVLFTYSLIEGLVIFRATQFEKGLDLSTSLIKGSLNLFGFYLEDFPADKLYNGDDYENMIDTQGKIPEENKRETFRIIKNTFESQKSHISALRYKALELKSLSDELKPKFFKKDNKNQNYIILLLNLGSNKYGKSWLRGFLFTFIVGLFFFYFTIITTDNYVIGWDISKENITKTSGYFFTFLTPTHKTNFLSDAKPTFWTYLLDFLGRIFIAYGIYQTVQAFRKYRS